MWPFTRTPSPHLIVERRRLTGVLFPKARQGVSSHEQKLSRLRKTLIPFAVSSASSIARSATFLRKGLSSRCLSRMVQRLTVSNGANVQTRRHIASDSLSICFLNIPFSPRSTRSRRFFILSFKPRTVSILACSTAQPLPFVTSIDIIARLSHPSTCPFVLGCG